MSDAVIIGAIFLVVVLTTQVGVRRHNLVLAVMPFVTSAVMGYLVLGLGPHHYASGDLGIVVAGTVIGAVFGLCLNRTMTLYRDPARNGRLYTRAGCRLPGFLAVRAGRPRRLRRRAGALPAVRGLLRPVPGPGARQSRGRRRVFPHYGARDEHHPGNRAAAARPPDPAHGPGRHPRRPARVTPIRGRGLVRLDRGRREWSPSPSSAGRARAGRAAPTKGIPPPTTRPNSAGMPELDEVDAHPATVSAARRPERRRLVITTVPVRTHPTHPATSCGAVTS